MRPFPLRLFVRIVSRTREIYLLKIITLAAAFASSTIVILFSLTEFGYDRFHHDANSVFRVLKKNTSERHNGNRLSTKIPIGIYKRLSSLSSDSLVVSRLQIMNGLTVSGDQKTVYLGNIHAADPGITDVFSFDIVDGSIRDFRRKHQQAMLSSSAARLLFGTIKANGKEFSVYSVDDTLRFQVSAVYDDFPRNSHEDFKVFISFETAAVESLGFNGRESGVYGRAIKLDIADLQANLQPKLNGKDLDYLFQPLPEVYFGPRVLGEDSRHGDMYSIWILIALTGLVLFLALATYVNLTSLTLPHRSKELAVRKLAGTDQLGLLLIFFKESLVIVALSFLMGTLLLLVTADLIQPILSIDLLAMIFYGKSTFFPIALGILLTLTLSPLFLTFKFISASPTRLLSTDTITFPRFKRVITVLQLGISIFLIVASLVIKRQINYSLLKEPGRNHDQVVYLGYPDDMTKEGLLRTRAGWQIYHPNIVDVIALSQLPDRINSKEINSFFYSLSVDPFFPEFFRLNMIRGNWFRPNSADSFLVLNDRGMREITAVESRNVIGIIDDINNQFNQPQKPIKFKVDENPRYNYLCVRILEVDIRRTINYLSNYFNGARIYMLNKRFEEWLAYQDRLNSLSNLLGIISALLSFCAIYGLSVSIVRDKLKQIAVHKICGANSRSITLLLARAFVKETFIAIAIFGPVTYIFLTEFLRGFVYSTDFQWLDPIVPVVYCILVISVLSGFQALTLNRNDLSSVLKS